MISVKVHRSYRNVVAICDVDLIGKRFEEGNRQLDLRENFFKGREMSHEDTIKLIQTQAREDSTFNIVGPKSIKAAKDSGLISADNVITINKVPFTLVLL